LYRRKEDSNEPVNYISYCVDCPNPHQEGSILHGLTPKYGLKTFAIIGEVVYSVPNHAALSKLLNPHEFHNRIVFADRGLNSLIEKVLLLQNAGALGIIIADDGQCDESFKYCGLRAGSAAEGGFSAHDDLSQWNLVKVPVMLISASSAEKFRLLMKVRRVKVPQIGFQNVSDLIPDSKEKKRKSKAHDFDLNHGAKSGYDL
jgi:hypothetical protein